MSRIELLKKYTKAVVHMRQQLHGVSGLDGSGNKFGGKFGLVFGAGISKPFKIPNWNELIKRIAKNSSVNGEEILSYKRGKSSQASITHMLFEHFKEKKIASLDDTTLSINEKNKIVVHSFREIIHKELWRNFKTAFLKINYHPYIETYINIVKKANLTINYNFDDTLQTLIRARMTNAEKQSGIRMYETVSDERLQFQRNKGIIYHPNGFLPHNTLESVSYDLVFSEDSFADQLIASMSGHYSTFLHHLSKNTCLLIGLSLEDSTLKHLLRQNAIINPGHYHYYVAYGGRGKKANDHQRAIVKQSNFDLYNLITLFLDDPGVKHLGELLELSDEEFADECRLANVKKRFVYYITGAVACGKTTTLSYFRNLTTFSEWPDQRINLLGRRFKKLKKKQREKVDKWIYSMFYKKNKNLTHVKQGITVIDRTPLDPLTFTAKKLWKQKAAELNNNINPSNAFKIVPGQIILLKGNKDTIASRNKTRNKPSDYSANDIEQMYKDFKKAFAPINNGVTDIQTTDLSIHDVVKEVAKVIHLDEYRECELHAVLDKIIKKKKS